jgi:hypothetical protein
LTVGAICIHYRRLTSKPHKWTVVEAEISLGNIGKIKIRPNHEVIQIAHKAWTELVTRKAALPFDQEHDLIIEVYNSWYTLCPQKSVGQIYNLFTFS